MPLIGLELDNDSEYKTISIRSHERHGEKFFLKLATGNINKRTVSVTLNRDEVAGLRDILSKYAEHHHI